MHFDRIPYTSVLTFLAFCAKLCLFCLMFVHYFHWVACLMRSHWTETCCMKHSKRNLVTFGLIYKWQQQKHSCLIILMIKSSEHTLLYLRIHYSRAAHHGQPPLKNHYTNIGLNCFDQTIFIVWSFQSNFSVYWLAGAMPCRCLVPNFLFIFDN